MWKQSGITKNSDPKWRCTKCKYEFSDNELIIETVNVVVSTASYGNTWVRANIPITRQEAFSYQVNNDSQSAIRQLKISRTPELILKLTGSTSSINTSFVEVPDLIIGGSSISVVKRRRGQQEFRLSLLHHLGEACFVSGNNPACVLEAAHISPFSLHETHSLSNGLLLRRDLHTLFDRHLLRINPENWEVEIAPQLHKYESYQKLHLKQASVDKIKAPNKDLLAEHFNNASLAFAI